MRFIRKRGKCYLCKEQACLFLTKNNMRILINFPTNLGDAIMGLPVLDRLKENYPEASISAIVSPKTQELLASNDSINQAILFDKFWPIRAKLSFCLGLRGKYGLVADLKNSFLPVLLGIRKRTPFIRHQSKDVLIKDTYLSLLDRLAPKKESCRSRFVISGLKIGKWQGYNFKKSIFIACSSLSRLKQYPAGYLKPALAALVKKHPVVILGQARDRNYYGDILAIEGVTDLVGKTAMSDVAYLLANYASLLLCVDSSILHIGSYLNIPIAALFGPTDPEMYGPWSKVSKVLQAENMAIEPKEVVLAAEEMLCNVS